MTQTNPEIRIVFPLYPGVTQLDFTGPHQVFSRLPGAKVTTASIGGQPVEADGLVFSSLADLAAVEGCDVLCVPGGLGTSEAMLDEAYMAQIRRLGAGARYMTSVCTGSLILAASGLIRGRRAACHWGWRELLELFGVVPDEGRVVRDGNLFTGGGVTAGLDFAFVVAAELAGEETAQRIQLGLEYAPAPPFDAGRPETAPTAVVEAARKAMAGALDGRRAAAAEAASRLHSV
ncbi:MAG: DJ-1/PfpI family protein [Phenylobacterium sp.]|uniref:DJ-1/PfpI family protein n=1 Tax=Phenylobacterium sp. TaxID=1871053 RepID=UPI0027372F1C|nr:DJ-1/PfpI family protein [Phenylobacterium sp.]MDP3175307.1 DJ-1/PfpI family protein [Phenylobacterium sp.]